MKKNTRIGICMLLIVVGFFAMSGSSAVALDDTTLFVTLDSAWEHAQEGDTFVIRADVKNIGDYPALITQINLENIPQDWTIHPHHQLILVLLPNQTKSKFFVVERGPTDATVYATAQAYNAPAVQSNRIAIPINILVIVGFSLVCGTVLYRETKMRKKQKR